MNLHAHVKLVTRLLIMSPLLLALGCSVVPLIEVFNHSGVAVRVIVGDDSYPVSEAAAESFEYQQGEVQVCRDSRLLRYAVPLPPQGYYHGIAFLFLRSRIRVQLEPDGRAWILRRGEQFPIRPNPDQPAPFPLSPEEIGSCDGIN